jgi:hypothetical protein
MKTEWNKGEREKENGNVGVKDENMFKSEEKSESVGK